MFLILSVKNLRYESYHTISIYISFLIVLLFKARRKISILGKGELESQMIEAYKEGLRELEKVMLFMLHENLIAELLYPQSEWASKAILMSAYAFYSQNYYERSVTELRDSYLNTQSIKI